MKKKNSIEHLDDVDVYFDPRPLTREDEIAISKFINENKMKKQGKTNHKKSGTGKRAA